MGINPNLLPQSQAAQFKQGFNQASAGLAAGVILAGLKVAEGGLFAGAVSGYSVRGRVALERGALNVNVTLLARLPGGGSNLRGLLGAFERAAGQAGAERLVISGRLANAFFKSDKARKVAAKLGYTFETLADGTITLTKPVT